MKICVPVIIMTLALGASSHSSANPAHGRGGANLFYYKLEGCERDQFRFNPAFYNRQKAEVDPVLESMYANGQRRLRVSIIWQHGGIFPIIDSSAGLSEEESRSIRESINTFRKIGFLQAEVVMGLRSPNGPGIWKQEWHEDLYRENLSMIDQIRSTLIEARFPYYIDLVAEGTPARNQPTLLRYVQRLWADYSARYGTTDTVGFSIIPNIRQNRFAQMRAIYGNRPPAAFDLHIYEDSYDKFINAHQQIAAQGYGHIPWIIGEALYNDATEADDIARAVQATGQRVLFLIAWPKIRGEHRCHGVDVAPPVEFNNYLQRGF